MTVSELKTKIVEEAKKRDTIILAHTYQNPDIIDISLMLPVTASF